MDGSISVFGVRRSAGQTATSFIGISLASARTNRLASPQDRLVSVRVVRLGLLDGEAVLMSDRIVGRVHNHLPGRPGTR